MRYHHLAGGEKYEILHLGVTTPWYYSLWRGVEPLQSKRGIMSEHAQRSHTIRVLIADTFPIVRTGLVAIVQAGAYMDVVGIATCRDELMSHLNMTAADVLITNMGAMGDAPVTLLQEIRQTHRYLGIIVFAAAVDLAPELLAAGGNGYVSYAEPDEHLHHAIRAAHAKQTYLSTSVQEYMDRWARIANQSRLVPREVQIIRLMAQGMDCEEIARHLDLQFWTVRNYISKIRRKMGWTTWPQMASWYQALYGSANAASLPQLHP